MNRSRQHLSGSALGAGYGDGGNRTHARFPAKLSSSRLAVQTDSPRLSRQVRQGAAGNVHCAECGEYKPFHKPWCSRYPRPYPSSSGAISDGLVGTKCCDRGGLPAVSLRWEVAA